MAPHPIYARTHIGRPIDASVPSNLAILIVIPSVGLMVAIAVFLSGAGPGASARVFVLSALTVFLVWALGRELAPDDDTTAFAAVAFAAVGMLVWPQTPLLKLALLLFLVRVVNRSVGPPAKLTDLAAVLLLTAVVVVVDNAWQIGFVAALALLLNGILAAPQRESIRFALVAAVIGGAQIAVAGIGSARSPLHLAALFVAFVFLVSLFTQPPMERPTDLGKEPPDRRRVQGGMLVALCAGLAEQLDGGDGFIGMLPLWAALFAVPVTRSLAQVRRIDRGELS